MEARKLGTPTASKMAAMDKATSSSIRVKPP
jgi:hypothetical protein